MIRSSQAGLAGLYTLPFRDALPFPNPYSRSMNPKRERHLQTEGRLLPNVTDARIRQIQRVTMALERLSRLQRRILAWLWTEDQRTRGTMAADHQDLVRELVALGFDKGNVSTSLKGLEAKGLVTIARTPSGRAEAIDLTREGRNRVAPLTTSWE